MIRIHLHKHKGRILDLKCSGHAEYADAGEDLVCAGISSILFGALNGLDEMFAADVKLKADDNCVHIEVCSDSDSLANALKLVEYQLKTVQEVYPQFVQIQQKEV